MPPIVRLIWSSFGASGKEPTLNRGWLPQVAPLNWVAVRELKLSYHDPETIVFTIHPEYGNLNTFLNSNPASSGLVCP